MPFAEIGHMTARPAPSRVRERLVSDGRAPEPDRGGTVGALGRGGFTDVKMRLTL